MFFIAFHRPIRLGFVGSRQFTTSASLHLLLSKTEICLEEHRTQLNKPSFFLFPSARLSIRNCDFTFFSEFTVCERRFRFDVLVAAHNGPSYEAIRATLAEGLNALPGAIWLSPERVREFRLAKRAFHRTLLWAILGQLPIEKVSKWCSRILFSHPWFE